MLLIKEQGGVSIGPYEWEHDGQAVEVDDHTATALLAIRGGDFRVPEPEPEPATETGTGQPEHAAEAAEIGAEAAPVPQQAPTGPARTPDALVGVPAAAVAPTAPAGA